MMKLHIITFPILLALSLSNSVYADWLDGVSNGSAQGSSAGNTSAASSGRGQGDSSGRGDFKGWGTGKGDADGEVDFQVTFKGKGRTDMDTKMSADGDGDWSGHADADGRSVGNSSGNVYGTGNGYSDGGNDYYSRPWRNGYYNPYPQQRAQQPLPSPYNNTPPAYGRYYTSPQALYFQQVQQQQEAQRKAMQAYYLQVQKQQQAFMAKTQPTVTPKVSVEKKSETTSSKENK